MAAKAHPEEHEHNSDLSSSSPSSSSQGKVHESMKENGGQKNKKEEKVGGVIRTALDEMSKGGSFERKESTWRDAISREDGAKFAPAKGRYHLFVAYACPWAHRTLMVRALKGLEDAISVTVVHPTWQKTKPNDPNDMHTGWVFGSPDRNEPLRNTSGLGGPFAPYLPETQPEPFYDSFSLRDLYERCGDTGGKFTVPVLWDKQTMTIVNNESSEILRILNSEFNDLATRNRDLDLCPADIKDDIDQVNSWVYPTINNGVYRCGFAKTQSAYDEAIDELTESFDRLVSILSKQRYIAGPNGDRFTEADVRLFVTLLRFDEVYHTYFKTNTRMVSLSDALLNYCREIYQMPGVAATCDMDHIKQHYYTSHPTLNTYSIMPRGANFIKMLEEPHNRDTIQPAKTNV